MLRGSGDQKKLSTAVERTRKHALTYGMSRTWMV